jgi:hypothetical protein
VVGLGRLRFSVVVGVVFAAACVGVVSPVPASAQVGGWWKLGVRTTPTVLVPGHEASVVVLAANIGDGSIAASEFAPVRVSLSLPQWLTPTARAGIVGPAVYLGNVLRRGEFGSMVCEPLPALSCTFPEGVPPFATLEVRVAVGVVSGAPSFGSSEALVEGGETQPGEPQPATVSVTHRMVTGASTPFGVERAELAAENEGGTLDVQAGSHPFQLTTTVALNAKVGVNGPSDPEFLKDVRVKLPPGLVGDANAVPQCDDTEFTSLVSGAYNLCPADSAVGGAIVTLNEPNILHYTTEPIPIFNLTPEQGEPARFGFDIQGLPVVLNTTVRTGADYGVTVSASNISQLASLVSSTLVFWGVPGAASHASARGVSCIAGRFHQAFGAPAEACDLSESSPVALLTLPPSCKASFQSTVEMDSWQSAGMFASATTDLTGSGAQALGMSGCNRVAFSPSISVTPDHGTASTPSGFNVDVHVPQEQALTPNGVAPADVKDIKVTLPAGVQVNPAAANGLAACTLAQIGLESAEEPTCPEASKIGTAEVVSPLLNHVLKGSVYVAAQNTNPFGSLLALYLVVKDPISGVLLKLAGKVSPDPVTGQLTVVFADLPELPFEDATISTFDGQRSALSTPSLCAGNYRTNASLAPSTGEEAVGVASMFGIFAGVGGSGCTTPEPFTPGFQAGTNSVQAGGFAPLNTSFSRPDGDQALGKLQIQLPPGLEADIASVPLCGEPAAGEGQCSAASLIGHVTAEAGLGDEPVTVEGGGVFLTGPYDGAPFGLSIVTDAKAGPFDLGVVTVRAAVNINPETAAVSVTSGAIPTILEGVPLQIKAVKVAIDRPGFVFDPTSCQAKTITGAVTSANAAAITVPVSSAFRVAYCETLAFKPKFSFATTAKHSKAAGADLRVKLAFPKAPFGSQANIAKVKVDLPLQLPTRQANFKYACAAAVFAASPEGCSVHAIVGQATAITPVLPVPLKGNAYLVSHGGGALPDIVMVLQGYGVTVDLTGTTHIKKGITSNTFASVPDVPVSSFELTLPQGKYSLLAGYGDFCKAALKSPVAFTAQNGVEVHETDVVTVTGCPKPKSDRRGSPAIKGTRP